MNDQQIKQITNQEDDTETIIIIDNEQIVKVDDDKYL